MFLGQPVKQDAEMVKKKAEALADKAEAEVGADLDTVENEARQAAEEDMLAAKKLADDEKQAEADAKKAGGSIMDKIKAGGKRVIAAVEGEAAKIEGEIEKGLGIE